ncbi:unnamed protein product [Phytophthora fragariaefolia]|uniref:Unnamed protein product n=1 Tax=Phytophthora fragariaefolia TaxID=1490495 RepID=A0A9W6Y234_9STRA|nr:unnamed protein product [Phytophthora fragariaefolia]
MILLKLTVRISERTTKKIARSGDNVDSVRVASLNHWLIKERVMHKKPKRRRKLTNFVRRSLKHNLRSPSQRAPGQESCQAGSGRAKRREKIELALAAEQNRIAVAEAKAAKRIVKAAAKDAKRISDAEAKRIARVETKNAKRIADAEAKELKRIAQAAAKEAKRIATEVKRATAANAKKARHLTTILGTEAMQSTGGCTQRSANASTALLRADRIWS